MRISIDFWTWGDHDTWSEKEGSVLNIYRLSRRGPQHAYMNVSEVVSYVADGI